MSVDGTYVIQTRTSLVTTLTYSQIRFLVLTFAVLSSTSNALDENRSHHSRETFRDEFSIQPKVVTYADNGIIICDSTNCTNITYHYLRTTYENLFSTPSLQDLSYVPKRCLGQTNEESMTKGSLDYTCNSPRDDGDKCCATFKFSTDYHGFYNNTSGERVYVFRLPSSHDQGDQYQMVTEGICLPGSFCGKKKKACVQEYAVQHLLAYKLGTSPPHASFQQINIPSYCSCKNIGDN